MRDVEVVVCGAGMAGIAVAHQLAVRCGVSRVMVIDEREPMSLTSSKGTEAYRNWWPSELLVRFMNRSIDLLEDLGDGFELNRRGYVFLTADPAEGERLRRSAAAIAPFGAHAEYFDDPALIRRRFPFVREDVTAMLHVRRAGWMNARALGRLLLERAVGRGVEVRRGRVAALDVEAGRFRAVVLEGGERIEAGAVVMAAGPLLAEWAGRLGLELPIVNELHGKIAFEDDRAVIPRDVPLMIWNDPVELGQLGRFPAGVHFRPRGERTILGIWTYDTKIIAPAQFPPNFEQNYAEILIAGLTEMIPGLAPYVARAGEAIVDGGYYCKAPDNLPLIGPLPIERAFIIGALSGYGVMSSQAAAELVAAHLTGSKLPDYAAAFAVDRVIDPAASATAGQL